MLQPIGKANHSIILIFLFLNYSSMFNMLDIKNLDFKTFQAIIFDKFYNKKYLGKVSNISNDYNKLEYLMLEIKYWKSNVKWFGLNWPRMKELFGLSNIYKLFCI